MIRKSALVVILVVASLIGAFSFLLGNAFIEDMIESYLSEKLDTEVEIEGLDIDLLDMTVGFERLYIEDAVKKDRFLAQSGAANFDVYGLQLLAKKLVVNEMTLNDLVIETEASHRPATEKEPASDGPEITIDQLSENLPELDLDLLAEELDIDEYVHPERLKSLQAINQAETSSKQKIAKWQETLDQAQFDEKISKIRNDANRLQKSKPNAIPEYQKTLNDLQILKKRTEDTHRDISLLNRNARQDLNAASSGFDSIRSLTEADIKGAEKLANIKEINASHIGMMLFGKEAVERFRQVKTYLEVARGFFGTRKKEERERGTGRYLTYPVNTTVYPRFLIQQLQLNGQLTKDNQAQVNWAGTVSDITSQQSVIDKPTVFAFSGDKIGTPARYRVQGVFDNRDHKGMYTVSIIGTDLKLDKVNLKEGDKSWPSYMSSEDSELTVTMTLEQNTLNGSVLLLAKSVQFAFSSPENSSLSETDRAIRETFRDLKQVEMRSSIKGSLSDPDFSVSSNIDDILSKRLDRLVGQKIAEARAAIRQRIESQVSSRKKQASQRINSQKQQLFSRLNRLQAQIDQQKQNIEKQITQNRRKMDHAVDSQKRSLEKEGKKKLENLFNN